MGRCYMQFVSVPALHADGKQAAGSAGVQEQNVVRLGEAPFPRHRKQPGSAGRQTAASHHRDADQAAKSIAPNCVTNISNGNAFTSAPKPTTSSSLSAMARAPSSNVPSPTPV